MIRYFGSRRGRWRLFLLVVLCGTTVIITVINIFVYTKYQQLSAHARTASYKALEVEATATQLGLPIDDGYLLPCDIPDGQRLVWNGQLVVTDGQLLVSCFSRTVFVRAAVVCDNWVSLRTPTNIIYLRPALDRIDVITESGELLSFHVAWVDGKGFRLTVWAEADKATKAAQTARKSLFAGVVALLLTNALGVRKLAASRHAPRRPGPAGRATWQQTRGRAWTDRVTVGLIASAVRALDHPDDQERYHEEWTADSEEVPAGWRRLRWAMGLRLCAPGGIRTARHYALPMSPPKQR